MVTESRSVVVGREGKGTRSRTTKEWEETSEVDGYVHYHFWSWVHVGILMSKLIR